MAWEWVAPTGTAVVGVAGIAGAWLTSRSSGHTQVRLATESRVHEVDQELRREKREAFTKFLSAFDAVDRATSGAGTVCTRIFAAQLSALGKSRNEVLGGSHQRWENMPDEISNQMSEDDGQAFSGAMTEFVGAFDSWETEYQHLLLCGGVDVVSAAKSVRDDLLEVWRIIACEGDWRYVDRKFRHELLQAMREELGYERVELVPPN